MTPDIPPALARRLLLRSRRAAAELLGGAYRSAFRGAGLAFDEVREYSEGDDVRSVDWNVTARAGTPFVKRFAEERQRRVLLVTDVSGSVNFGSAGRRKRDALTYAASLVAQSAAANGDALGLAAVTDRVEHYLSPRRLPRHAARVAQDIANYQPRSPRTDLAAALAEVDRLLKRRSLVLVFSDFAADDFAAAFLRLARRHDLIAVRVTDPLELELPDAGLVQLEDAETGQSLLVDTSDAAFRSAYAQRSARRRGEFTSLARGANVDLVELDTATDPLVPMLELFRRRARERGGA